MHFSAHLSPSDVSSCSQLIKAYILCWKMLSFMFQILEALTTEKCHERFSLERLEVLGDAFLKFVVGRHLFLLHDTLDEGQLTRKRSSIVNNSNLFKLAKLNNLQVINLWLWLFTLKIKNKKILILATSGLKIVFFFSHFVIRCFCLWILKLIEITLL